MKIDKVVIPRVRVRPVRDAYPTFEEYNRAYNRWVNGGNEIIGDIRFTDSSQALSCAFPSVRGRWSNDENVVWRAFCYVLEQAQKCGKDVFIPITDKEPRARDLFLTCPFVVSISVAVSKHEPQHPYNAYIFVLRVGKGSLKYR